MRLGAKCRAVNVGVFITCAMACLFVLPAAFAQPNSMPSLRSLPLQLSAPSPHPAVTTSIISGNPLLPAPLFDSPIKPAHT
ncbi:MAG: hypothetical protein WCL29_02150, partial [Pseudomonadota bacterium]